jgi:hypothetical protein
MRLVALHRQETTFKSPRLERLLDQEQAADGQARKDRTPARHEPVGKRKGPHRKTVPDALPRALYSVPYTVHIYVGTPIGDRIGERRRSIPAGDPLVDRARSA